MSMLDEELKRGKLFSKKVSDSQILEHLFLDYCLSCSLIYNLKLTDSILVDENSIHPNIKQITLKASPMEMLQMIRLYNGIELAKKYNEFTEKHSFYFDFSVHKETLLLSNPLFVYSYRSFPSVQKIVEKNFSLIETNYVTSNNNLIDVVNKKRVAAEMEILVKNQDTSDFLNLFSFLSMDNLLSKAKTFFDGKSLAREVKKIFENGDKKIYSFDSYILATNKDVVLPLSYVSNITECTQELYSSFGLSYLLEFLYHGEYQDVIKEKLIAPYNFLILKNAATCPKLLSLLLNHIRKEFVKESLVKNDALKEASYLFFSKADVKEGVFKEDESVFLALSRYLSFVSNLKKVRMEIEEEVENILKKDSDKKNKNLQLTELEIYLTHTFTKMLGNYKLKNSGENQNFYRAIEELMSDEIKHLFIRSQA